MRIDVALLPGQMKQSGRSLAIVVDVLRASSSIVTLLERKASRVLPAAGVEEARRLKERLGDHLLCGERGGLPPAGFDYGNSPAEFAGVELAGRGIVLATSNGTRVLSELAGAPAVIVGSLLNRTACARAALAMARERNLDINVVCAAGGSTFAVEDALGAGAIVEMAAIMDQTLELSDSARFAVDAFVTASTDLPAALASAYHARDLSEAGFGEDVAYCAQLDITHVVPVLDRGENGLLVLRPAARLPQP
jgi:2-phosphosulfolactate phosphatase